MKLEQLGKVENCGIFPTPVQRLDNLSREYHYELFVKRDDLTGIGFSGNKIRKLQYLVKDALDKAVELASAQLA